MIDNKNSNETFTQLKKKYATRLEMLENKALQKVNQADQLQKYIPNELQNFCNIVAIDSNKIIIHVYPAIYLRHIKALEKQLIANIRADFAEDFANLTGIDIKVRPLQKKTKPTIEPVNNKHVNNKPEKRTKSQSTRLKLANLAKEINNPALKAQLEKMAKY